MALSKTTQDHDEIQQWAEKRGAVPAEVTSTHSKNEPGILRFCFPKAPNHNNASLRELPWDEFFQKFDENGLELVYQDVTAEGAESNFNKLIYPTDESHSGPTDESHSGRRAKSSSTHAGASHSGSGSTSHSKSSGSSSASKSSGSHSTGTHSKSSSPASTGKSSSSGKSSGGSSTSKSKGSHKAA